MLQVPSEMLSRPACRSWATKRHGTNFEVCNTREKSSRETSKSTCTCTDIKWDNVHVCVYTDVQTPYKQDKSKASITFSFSRNLLWHFCPIANTLEWLIAVCSHFAKSKDGETKRKREGEWEEGRVQRKARKTLACGKWNFRSIDSSGEQLNYFSFILNCEKYVRIFRPTKNTLQWASELKRMRLWMWVRVRVAQKTNE